jgi:large subunit ribosomal protein L32
MHLFLEKPTLGKCAKCGKPVKTHMACPACGFYKGKEVIDVLSKLDRRSRREKEREMSAQKAQTEKAGAK